MNIKPCCCTADRGPGSLNMFLSDFKLKNIFKREQNMDFKFVYIQWNTYLISQIKLHSSRFTNIIVKEVTEILAK